MPPYKCAAERRRPVRESVAHATRRPSARSHSPGAGRAEQLRNYYRCTTRSFFQKILCCAPCPQHNILEKNNMLWQVCRNTLFFQKMLCCGKFVTTHYFLSYNTLSFSKKYCVVRHVRNTIFKKNNVL